MHVRPRALGLISVAGAFCLYLATFNNAFPAPDERARLALAEAIAENGPTAIVDSGKFCRYPPLTSIVASPFVWAGRELSGGNLEAGKTGAAVAQVLVTAASVGAFFWLLIVLGHAPWVSSKVTLLFALTNPIWPYSKRLYSEPLSGLLVILCAVGVIKALRGSWRGLGLLVGAMALLLLNVPAAAATTSCACLAGLVLGGRWRRAVVAGIGFGFGGCVVLASQWLRFGKLASGYEGETFTFQWADGLWGLFLSPGRSIFLYAPLVAMSVVALPIAWRRHGAAVVTVVLGAVAMQTVLMAAWWSWHGGDCYGPRLVLPALPLGGALAADLAGRKLARWLLVPATVLGLYAQALGIPINHEYDSYLWPDGERDAIAHLRYDWAHAQLHRVPRDIALVDPPELSLYWIARENRQRTLVHGDGAPMRYVEIVQGGQSVVCGWHLHEARIIAGSTVLDARRGDVRIVASPTVDSSGTELALDGDPATFWLVNRFKRPGQSFRFVLSEPRRVTSIELAHAPSKDEFPSRVVARASVDGHTWRTLSVDPGSPRLSVRWPLIAALLGALGCAIWLLGATRRRPREA